MTGPLLISSRSFGFGLIIKLIHAIPEKEREEFEFIADAMIIAQRRTMKEAFKLGGYAWHAHKRFEALKGNWSFNKTVEWLDSVGIRFDRMTIKNFMNVYATYVENSSPLVTSTLIDACQQVNGQADEVVGMPDSKVKIIGKIFTALPSDDSTNPKELIRELIRAGKVFAVTERTIQRWKPEALKQKRLSQEEVQKIQELKEAGKSNREIASEIGVSHTAINKLETSDKCQKLPDSPEPSNVIPSPVQFQKQEPVDDYDDEGVGGGLTCYLCPVKLSSRFSRVIQPFQERYHYFNYSNYSNYMSYYNYTCFKRERISAAHFKKPRANI